jgi:hypothetical protein
MWLLLGLVVIGATVAFFYFKKNAPTAERPNRQDNKTRSDIPSHVLIPSSIKGHANILAWEFLAPNLSTACNYARNHAGLRKKAQDCAALPLSDCNSTTCKCHYRPIFDSRKRQRRQDLDRRNAIRFDAGEDRRKLEDRRANQPNWQDKHIK